MELQKVAVVSAGQGFPEELDNDPVNTYTISRAFAEALQAAYPTVEVNLLNRDDYPGDYDFYRQAKLDLQTWGCQLAFHVHQDDPASGWLVCYRYAERLANEMAAGMATLPIAGRGTQYRTDIAVLNVPYDSVLVEFGKMTTDGSGDEAIGVAAYVQAALKGAANYIYATYRLLPTQAQKQQEEDDMNPAPEGRKHCFPNIWKAKFNHWMHIKDESGKGALARIIVTRRKELYNAVGETNVIQLFGDRGNQGKLAIPAYQDVAFDLNAALQQYGIAEDSCSVTVETDNDTCCQVDRF